MLISLYRTCFLLQQYRGFTFEDVYSLYPFEMDIIYGLIIMDNEERRRKEMEEKSKKR
jgi:hypothetical protein